jgi:hypothetical protein
LDNQVFKPVDVKNKLPEAQLRIFAVYSGEMTKQKNGYILHGGLGCIFSGS